MQTPTISLSRLRDMLADGAQLALLDLREEGVFTRGHLLLAASLPLSRLEVDMRWRVPRLDTRIVLVDEDEVRIARAAALLARAGYTQVQALADFPAGCTAAGLGIFSGKHVPSKAFGEVVETTRRTPHVDIPALLDMQARGVPLLMLDSRTLPEFEAFSLPGATSCPGAELALRVPDALPAEGVVLVNCAGRTRSIIGAQSLINAGIGRRVYAVENGTMGWHLSGRELVHGDVRMLPQAQSAHHVARSRQVALALLQRTGGRVLGWRQVQDLLQDRGRTTYFYDTRLPDAYAAGTLPGARHAQGGELVQATDHYAPVRHARIVLMDAQLVQAPMTAHWLRQMGWEADVLDPSTAPAFTAPDAPRELLLPPADVDRVDVPWLQRALANGTARVIDCASSIAFRHGHIPGAWFSARGSLPGSLRALPTGDETLVFTGDDALLTHFAAADAQAAGHRCVRLAGGTRAWQAAGLPLEAGAQRMLGACDDVWYSPYEVEPEAREQAMHDYIAWETGLTARIAGEQGVHFQVLQESA